MPLVRSLANRVKGTFADHVSVTSLANIFKGTFVDHISVTCKMHATRGSFDVLDESLFQRRCLYSGALM